MDWSLESQSLKIRGVQDIEKRLPKLLSENFASKMMDFR